MNLSIALCTYNGEEYLREQLDSYTTQTQLPDELVVCDDGSIDNTISILERFAQSAPFQVHIEQNKPSLGGPKNFEKALSLCGGDLIFFSDQDDRWRPNKVETTVRFAEANPERWGFFSNATLLQEGQVLDYTLWDAIDFTPQHIRQTGFDDLLDYIFTYRNPTYGTTLALRREALPLLLPFRLDAENMWHDEWISLRLALEKRYAYINEPLIDYRLHAAQEVGLRWTNDQAVQSQNKLYASLEQESSPPDGARLRMVKFWDAYRKTARYQALHLPELDHLKEDYYRQFRAARSEFLKLIPFAERKARLLKWYSKKQFHTTLGEVIRL